MMSPVAIEFAGMLATVGLFFCLWHYWRYDRFRCLVPNKDNAFLCIMCWTIVVALSCLVAFTWVQAYVLYDVLQGVTMPTPAQLWPEHLRSIWRQSLYILSVGWVCMHAVHLEEFLYWAYLIDSIRKPSSRPTTWFRSVYCKLWLGGSIACAALVGGAAAIETGDVQRMRAWIFLIGGSVSTLLAIASTVLSLSLPSFVRAVHSSGASSEVVSRLAFYQELHFFRTVCRWVFGICSMIQAADGITAAQRINRMDFWPDFLTVASLFSIFWALTISVIVLLPRNINSEAQPIQAKQAMRQFNPHRESRVPMAMPMAVPQLAPVPASKRASAKKRTAAGAVDVKDGAAFDTDIDELSNDSLDSIVKAASPISPAPAYTEISDTDTAPTANGPTRRVNVAMPNRRNTTHSSGNRSRNRNNLHVLGERLNIDAQQLRDLMQEDEGERVGEIMEMPVLQKQRSAQGHGLTMRGAGPGGAEPNRAPVPILLHGNEKHGTRHVEHDYHHRQSPFDDKAAMATPTIRVHSPEHYNPRLQMQMEREGTEVVRTPSPGFHRHQSAATDSIDSLPYAQPRPDASAQVETQIETQPSLHSLSPEADDFESGLHGHAHAEGPGPALAERERVRNTSGLSQASQASSSSASPSPSASAGRKKSTSSKDKEHQHPFSASAVDRRARLQARDESEFGGGADVGQANKELARFLDKGPGPVGPGM